MKHRDQGTKNRKELLSHLTSPFLCHRHVLPCVESYDSVAEEHPPTEQSHKGTGSLHQLFCAMYFNAWFFPRSLLLCGNTLTSSCILYNTYIDMNKISPPQALFIYEDCVLITLWTFLIQPSWYFEVFTTSKEQWTQEVLLALGLEGNEASATTTGRSGAKPCNIWQLWEVLCKGQKFSFYAKLHLCVHTGTKPHIEMDSYANKCVSVWRKQPL